jgi:hypothetical protein
MYIAAGGVMVRVLISCYNIQLPSISDFYNIGPYFSNIVLDSLMMAF